MSELPSHLVDINTVLPADLNHLVISQFEKNGKIVVVSIYGDPRWNLTPYVRTRNHRDVIIIFNVKLVNGSLLTDKQNESLLHAAKRFLYVRWKVKAPHSGKYISARTLHNNWGQLRALLNWMVQEGLNYFSDLTAKKCLNYVRYCQTEKSLSRSTQTLNYQIITTYFDLQNHLNDKLPEYPWQNVVPLILAGNSIRINKSSTSGSTEIIPLRLLKIIVQRALDYVEHKADRLLFARDGVAAIRSAEYQQVVLRHKDKYPMGFSSIYESEEVYLQVKTGHRSVPVSNRWLAEYALPDYKELDRDLNRLRTACYIVCAIFSGMRVSELMSLGMGCFLQHRGFDDEEYCWLKGKTYKLEEDPKDAEWMVPPIVGKAIAIAEKLSAPLREKLSNRISCLENLLKSLTMLPKAKEEAVKELSESRKHEHALFMCKKEYIRSQTSAMINCDLKSFTEFSGAITESSDMVGVIDTNKIMIGKPWPLASHQFRRTFAVLVARNLMGDVRYLREHLKHWSIDMTLYYARHEQSYIDDTLLTEILTERDELQTVILERWLSGDAKLSGGTGRRLTNFRGRDDVKVVKDMHEFCRRLGEDVFIRGTGHSWCMCSDSGSDGHCLYDAIKCSYCDDSVIDDTHIQVWRGIREQQIEVLKCPDLGESMWQRCVNHLGEAERILRELGDEPELYSIPERPYSSEVEI